MRQSATCTCVIAYLVAHNRCCKRMISGGISEQQQALIILGLPLLSVMDYFSISVSGLGRKKELFQIPVSASSAGFGYNISGISRDLPGFHGSGKQDHSNVTDNTFITMDCNDLVVNNCCRQPDWGIIHFLI